MTGEAAPEPVALTLEVLSETLGKNYPWPGNVRELEQALRRILLKRRYDEDTRMPEICDRRLGDESSVAAG